MKNNRITIQFVLVILLHLFLVLVTIYNASKSQSLNEKILISYIALLSLIAFYKTWKSNPGYITIQENNFHDSQALVLGNNTIVNTYCKAKTIFREIANREGIFIERFCTDCKIFRNRFVTHCRFCDCCVLHRDHHCSWLDTCVAANNIDFFVVCIFSILLMCIYDFLRFKSKNIFIECIFRTLMAGVALLFFFLCSYYVFLMCAGITSCEFIKSNRSKKIFKLSSKISLFNKKNIEEANQDYSEYQC